MQEHKDVTKKFDNKTIVGRLRMVSWSNYRHQTDVNRFTRQTFQISTTNVQCAIKRAHI